jgi:4-hydroxyphenylacetate 3-monooxygenase oxygenase component
MAPRNGQQYIEGLRDSREVWLNGQVVKDVTEEPLLRPAIDATAQLYDMQHEAAYTDELTANSDFGGRIGRTYQPPRNYEDLVQRRKAIAAWMGRSCGFLGRSPDFLNTMITAMRCKSDFFAKQSADRKAAIESYYEHAARNDLFLTHSLHDAQIDRSKRRSEQPDPGLALHVVEETPKGLIVSGAKMVATAAAYADDILLWPAVPNFGPGDDPYALACSVPIATPGVRVICRPSFVRPDAKSEYPLSSRFDEMDAAVIFNRALVPWDRVFLYNDRKLITEMYPRTRIRELTAHQTTVRLLVKLEFMYALLVRLTEAVGRETLQSVTVLLGETVANIEIIRACLLASEHEAETDPENGVLYPDFSALMAARIMGPRIYPELIHKIRRIGSSALMQVPSSLSDFDTELNADLNRYYRSAQLSARERTLLLRCAWDVSGSDFGSRHALYELFYAGDPEMNLERMQRENPRKGEQVARFDQFFRSLVDEADTRSRVSINRQIPARAEDA